MHGTRPATRSGDAGPSQYRGGRRNNRGGYRPQAAHERALLQTRNDDIEHFLGVEAKSNKFRDLAEISDDEEADMDVETDDTDKSDGEVVEAQSKSKAVRTQSSSRADGDSVPRWSNPDPYTVLPPPEETTGKRIDFVKLIRKAKNEVAEQSNEVNAVAANDDFISFGDDKDDDGFEPPVAPSVLASRAKHLQGSLNDITASGSAPSIDVRGKRPADQAGLPARPPLNSLPARPTFTSNSSSSSRKRKHTDDHAGIKDVWQPKDHLDPAPWAYREDYHRLLDQPEKLLHNEIADFYDFVAPTDHDKAVRLDLIRRVQSVIGGEFQSHRGSIHCFGSFPIGLYLPTADMDLVFVSDSHYQGGPPKLVAGKSSMFNLAKKLKFNQVAYDTFVIPKARVPIIKFKDLATDLPVDISFENLSGVIAQSTLSKWNIQFGEHFTNLIALVKQLLEMYSLNDNSTGGLGGLSICCLVASFLQLHELPENLGQTFLQFLDFFGNKFDYSRDRIVVDPPRIARKVSTNACDVEPMLIR
jgi:non-canonical poly(A) RNA polymerase PAPD5/7